MGAEIKAIETVYKGYRFRSRLEARWAVFFDALGVRWEYEKETFDLGDAGWYLPDFWLPDFDCWVEVKGVDPSDAEYEKVSCLARLSEKTVAIFVGGIGDHYVDGVIGPKERLDDRPFQVGSDHIVRCPRCGAAGGVVGEIDLHEEILLCVSFHCDRHGYAIVMDRRIVSGETFFVGWGAVWDLINPYTLAGCDKDRETAAIAAARSARFEFGQNGATI